MKQEGAIMVKQTKIMPWERLQRLYEMSELERPVYAKQWANELVRKHGAGNMPRYMQAAHRETIAAALLFLVDEQTSMSDDGYRGRRGVQTNSFVDPASDVLHSDQRTDDVSPSVIRAWAQQRGISVNARGRIPMWVTKRYHLEHAAESDSLADKIRAALERHGELTKSELWDVIGRNHPSWKIEQAIETLPNVEVLKGRSRGGRPPMIFRWAEKNSNDIAVSAGATVRRQCSLGDPQDMDRLAVIVDKGPSDPNTVDSKTQEFIQILRGESRSD
ncbi:hypothetical protein E1293_04735 [Actinomadura darangshiensis]|uniref:Lsr2 DNA-binding domain-containing protein n=1 Tax=Actinomadura darangshiensis TaxID=705336 RepID=A0A4R5BTY5_9ACTN|nr:histone-like nucleoid-structuring protein Lsr2 [Actinomadura darangshiensis]TDD89519.1 hypothetical protein E1293_04735 [Actinomadura darangshiensis]